MEQWIAHINQVERVLVEKERKVAQLTDANKALLQECQKQETKQALAEHHLLQVQAPVRDSKAKLSSIDNSGQPSPACNSADSDATSISTGLISQRSNARMRKRRAEEMLGVAAQKVARFSEAMSKYQHAQEGPLKALQEQLSKIPDEQRAVELETAQHQSALDEAEQQVAELRKKLQTARERADKQSQQHSQQQTAIHAANDQLTAAKGRTRSLKSQLSSLQQDVAAAQARENSSMQRLQEARRRKAAAETACNKLTDAIATAKHQVAELTA